MIEFSAIERSYGSRKVLGPLSGTIAKGERVAVMGPSGAGKTTLLMCLAGLETPDAGHIDFFGKRWSDLSETARRRERLSRLGLLFQTPDLLAELTLLNNVSLPLEFLGVSKGRAEARATELLGDLGVAGLRHQHPAQVSGGEAQRAALARALVADPVALLADEPTGSLSSADRDAVLELITNFTARCGTTVVVVTHDPVVASAMQRTVDLVDGLDSGGRCDS